MLRTTRPLIFVFTLGCFSLLPAFALGQGRVSHPDSNGIDGELIQPIDPTQSPFESNLQAIELSIAPELPTPKMKSVSRQLVPAFDPAPKTLWLEPAGVSHRRLLFDEPRLERHGFSCNECNQPIVSGVRFFSKSILLPFHLSQHRLCESSERHGIPRVD